MLRLLITFIIFAGIIYYFNLDIIHLVEKTGAPQWLQEKGFITKSPSVATSTATSSPTIIQISI